MNGLNLAVFTDCRVVNTWDWQDGSLVVRCEVPDPAGDRSFVTFVIKNGNTLGLQLEHGQHITVKNAAVQSRDITEPVMRFISRAEGPDGRAFDLDRAFDSAGLDDEQRETLRNMLRRAQGQRVMTEFVVDPNDLTVHDRNGRQ